MAKKHDIIWYDRLDSTNDEAGRRISELDNLSVLSASWQTSGRGQRGNTWISAAGENLTFSVVLKYSMKGLPAPPALRQFILNEIASLSVVGLLARHNIEAKIKWPNDIYAGDRKICGMLIEHSLMGKLLSHSIVGIGLNVNQTEFDPSLPNPTSMKVITAQHHEPEALLEEFMDIFEHNLRSYIPHSGDNIDTEAFRKKYIKHLWRMNETSCFIDHTVLPEGHHNGPMNIVVSSPAPSEHESYSSFSSAGRVFTGIIRGLTPFGHIMIEDTEKGELKEFAFKEIGYII